MKSRPILFSAPMVRALLDGCKTQTRRAWRDQPPAGVRVGFVPGESTTPYGKSGDQLWVREAWAQPTSLDPGPTFYRADYPACVPSHFENVPPADQIKWKPSIHMFRHQSRIQLEITGVRVERLQDISEADARAEGVFPGSWEYDNGEGTETAKESYECLWNSINGTGSWDLNPWVWCISFRRIKP